MYNWSTNESTLKKSPEKYAVWKLEQLVNFGLNGEKIDKKELQAHWSELSLDPWRKKFLQFILNA